MGFESLIENIMHPPVLFFLLGLFAVAVKSDLEIPPQVAKFLSLYLLFDIGIKGGQELFHSGFTPTVLKVVMACLFFSFAIPWAVYKILRQKLDNSDASAIASSFGSVSAVTFATTLSFLQTKSIAYGGYMVAGMALMESPAIISGLLLYNTNKQNALKKITRIFAKQPVRELATVGASGSPSSTVTYLDQVAEFVPEVLPLKATGGMSLTETALHNNSLLPETKEVLNSEERHGETPPQEPRSMKAILHEAIFNGSVLLLVGSLVIGLLAGTTGEGELKPFVNDIFKGVLSLYMLDMGILAAKRFSDLKKTGPFLIIFGICYPILASFLGIGTSILLGLQSGDALLLTILIASASYIAVPAAMRNAIPEANMSLLLPISLGVTFTFNIVAGIPLYNYMIHLFLGH